jgi:hypothetical protein
MAVSANHRNRRHLASTDRFESFIASRHDSPARSHPTAIAQQLDTHLRLRQRPRQPVPAPRSLDVLDVSAVFHLAHNL